jgi:hypothetical protein
MPIYVGSTLLVLASNSEADIIFDGDVSDDEWESLQAENYEQTDYSHQFDTFTGQLVVIIFALGVVSGLLFSKIMWGRIK